MYKTILISILAAGLLAGCQPQGKLDIPDSFVQLPAYQARPYQTRAVSADGVVLALRTEPNPRNGTLAFWSKAITEKMTTAKGYKLVGSEEVTGSAGQKGRKLHLTRVIKGVDYTYLMAIYVTGQQVEIVEAGGKSEHVQPLMQQLDQSLKSL